MRLVQEYFGGLGVYLYPWDRESDADFNKHELREVAAMADSRMYAGSIKGRALMIFSELSVRYGFVLQVYTPSKGSNDDYLL